MKMKTVVVYSGGLDSTVLLYWLLGRGHALKALGVNYGQRHRKELLSAESICSDLGVPFEVADLSLICGLLAGSSQTSVDVSVPEGHYTEESMKATVVPNRNMIILSVAIGHAISLRYDAVAYAAHGGDHVIYPDCRSEFAALIDAAAAICDWHRVRLERPFVEKTKAQLVSLGNQLGVPFERTWSCLVGLDLHCGRCGACMERREAFELAGTPDLTEYEG
jgi:7-cyano-7-deazaguanine synthase